MYIAAVTDMVSYVLRGVGRLFYIVPPKATTFAFYQEVPDYIAESIPFFIMTIALEFSVLVFRNGGKGLQKERLWDASRYSVNDMVGSIGAGIVQQLTKFFLYNITLNSYLYVYENFRLVTLDYQNIWLWIAGFFIIDLGYYIFHRAAHEVNLFWAAHVVHHSSEYYNQTTALRQSVFQVYTSWIFDLPAALFLPPSLYVMHKQFNTLFQYWIHTEVIGNLGPLEYIINTPSAHRVHHGRNPYCIDKNYAGTLIIWDIMFGTFELEQMPPNVKAENSEHVAFGLTHPINTFDPFIIQFHHLNHVLRTFCATAGISNKFKVLFYGPGWHDDTPRTGLLEEIPLISRNIPPQKYDPPLSFGINVYVVIHFAVLVGVSGILLAHQPGELNRSIVVTTSAYVFSTLTTFGYIFDHRTWAIEYELLRSVCVCCAIEIAKQSKYLTNMVAVVLQVFHIASGLWLGLNQRPSFQAIEEIKKTE